MLLVGLMWAGGSGIARVLDSEVCDEGLVSMGREGGGVSPFEVEDGFRDFGFVCL